MCSPDGVNHAMSPISLSEPRAGSPWKNRRRRNTGWSRRSFDSADTKSVSAQFSRASAQSTQDSGLSWQ